jgi:hypothetical protein
MQDIRASGPVRNSSLTTNAHSAGTSNRRGSNALCVRYRVSDDPHRREREVTGRFAWALLQLHRAGEAGITSLENPAPRLSHYIHILRRDGLNITTEYEDHGGAFAGRHGRYRLTTPIGVIEIREPMGANR